MEQKDKVSLIEEKLYTNELKLIHGKMNDIALRVFEIFSQYGKSGFTSDLTSLANQFMKDNFWIKYDYQSGKVQFDKTHPLNMKVPTKLEELIRWYSINQFVQKLDEVQSVTDELYDQMNK